MHNRHALDLKRIVVLNLCLLALAARVADCQVKKPRPFKTDPAEVRRLLKVFVSEFVEITPGQGRFPKSFSMGSAAGPRCEQPVRKVTFGHSFAMARFEVPQNLYTAVMGVNPSIWQGPKRGRNSVEMLSWRNAAEFCRKITRMLHSEKLIAGDETIRLPSEAEWEYCCRAGTATAYSFGDKAAGPKDRGNKAALLDVYAWHTGNASGNDPPVGALKPNAWGLYDMHGYLWEYVSDAWHGDYSSGPADGGSWDGGKTHVQRVIRGGSWRDRYEDLRSAARQAVPDHVLSDAIGFRCVKSRAAKTR